MYLFINTSQKEKMQIALLDKAGQVLVLQNIKSEYQQSEKLLPAIENIFKKAKIEMKSLKGILAVAGPGGFTSLRIGLATANTLAFSFNIPIVGLEPIELSKTGKYLNLIKKISRLKKFKQSILPEYGSEPNIG
jgi:tRNA threonylcarbamoyl adenosine modification protein YeaZ